jgi:hypothetical protein
MKCHQPLGDGYLNRRRWQGRLRDLHCALPDVGTIHGSPPNGLLARQVESAKLRTLPDGMGMVPNANANTPSSNCTLGQGPSGMRLRAIKPRIEPMPPGLPACGPVREGIRMGRCPTSAPICPNGCSVSGEACVELPPWRRRSSGSHVAGSPFPVTSGFSPFVRPLRLHPARASISLFLSVFRWRPEDCTGAGADVVALPPPLTGRITPRRGQP